ncbi:hypothetical protein DSO57_1010816 [Entomophthora muscae]|uniref:Uncharacterized protein n=1 Tax=Entomophthora muscae TaxID=34485 RepID=A0ACC2S8H2_9FUNG|nr:hypothetical protein DSO57_1010816 [Entomophthora muscae]
MVNGDIHNSMDKHLCLLVQAQKLSLKIAGGCATATVQKIQIMKPSKVQLTTIFTTLEESVHQLWTLQPPVEREVEFSYGIRVLNSNSQDSSSRSDNTGIDPNHKLLFKKGFNPKTSTITFFLALYEIEMCMLMMGIKKPDSIFSSSYMPCQE